MEARLLRGGRPTVSTLVFLLEEPSAREMLKGVMPRLAPDIDDVRYVCFEGKQDMHRQLERKLRGWLTPQTWFVVLRDQDSGDCRATKAVLRDLCARAGKPAALIRIACHELESFYLGDLAAVAEGLETPTLAAQQGTRRFRDPDRLGNPSRELVALSRQSYQKVGGSRSISPHLRLDGSNRSHSFNVLVDGIRRVVAGPTGI